MMMMMVVTTCLVTPSRQGCITHNLYLFSRRVHHQIGRGRSGTSSRQAIFMHARTFVELIYTPFFASQSWENEMNKVMLGGEREGKHWLLLGDLWCRVTAAAAMRYGFGVVVVLGVWGAANLARLKCFRLRGEKKSQMQNATALRWCTPRKSFNRKLTVKRIIPRKQLFLWRLKIIFTPKGDSSTICQMLLKCIVLMAGNFF